MHRFLLKHEKTNLRSIQPRFMKNILNIKALGKCALNYELTTELTRAPGLSQLAFEQPAPFYTKTSTI